MRVKNLNLMIISSVLLLALLISPGCMLMHFMGDHPEGMMGYGAKSNGKDNDPGGHTAHQQAGLPDKRTRTDSQGGITVQIQFKELTEKGELAFTVRMRDPLTGINADALDSLAILVNDGGIQVQASRWQSIVLSPQHVSGTLYFPAQNDAGKSLLPKGVRTVTMRVKGLAGIPERAFEWKLGSEN